VTATESWLAARIAGAPEGLRFRIHAWADGAGPEEELAWGLAQAAGRALAAAVGQGRERAAALDLLASDALVTLALLRQAETAPEGLEAFARRVRLAGNASS